MTTSNNRANPPRPITIWVTSLVALVAFFGLFIGGVFYSLPSNVVSQRDGSDTRWFFSQLLPESWAFFTKPPNAPEFTVYSVAENEITSALQFPHSKKENWYGVSRKQRAQGPEMANLAAQAESQSWTSCETVSGDCVAHVASNTSPITAVNRMPRPSLCGTVVISETEPVPWTHRNEYDGWRQDKKAVLLESKCE